MTEEAAGMAEGAAGLTEGAFALCPSRVFFGSYPRPLLSYRDPLPSYPGHPPILPVVSSCSPRGPLLSYLRPPSVIPAKAGIQGTEQGGRGRRAQVG